MSHLLSRWLNSDIRLSVQVSPTGLDDAFCSGYLLAELLNRFDLIELNNQFSSTYSVESSIKNFTLLEKALREKLDIHLSSNEAYDLIQAKPGCAAKLLYQIKVALSRYKAHPDAVRRSSLAASKAKASSAVDGHVDSGYFMSPLDADIAEASYPSSPQDTGVPTSVYPEPHPKRLYNEKEHEFFAEMLRSKLRNCDRAGYKLKPKSKDVLTARTPREQPTRIKKPLLVIKENTHKGRKSPRPAATVADDEIPALPVKAIKPVGTSPTTLLSFQARRAHLMGAIQRDIDRFELQHMYKPKDPAALVETADVAGIENGESSRPETPGDSHDISKFISLKASMEPSIHMKTLASLLPSSDASELKSQAYLEKIRIKKLEEQVAKKDREQRRRRVLLNQQKIQEDIEKTQIEQIILSSLMRQSKQERRIAEQLMCVRHEKEVMKNNRIFRENQYAERRQRDYELALEREYELAELARQEYNRQTALQLEQHKSILNMKAEKKHRKNTMICLEIVNQIVDLSVRISEYRTYNDRNELPKKLLREWKTLFLSSQPVQNRYEIVIEVDRISIQEPTQTMANEIPSIELPTVSTTDIGGDVDPDIIKGVQILDEQEFTDYLHGEGDWMFPISERYSNELLAVLVNNILESTMAPEPTNETPILPLVPIRLALLGKPFAGKHTMARKLASIYSLKVLLVDELVQEAIRLADVSDKPRPLSSMDRKGGKKPAASKGQIGAKLQLSMLEGGTADDNLVVSLVVDAIRKATPSDDNPISSGGWVLVDFPANRNQAQLLEKELSGYEDPKPVKLGNLKRTPKEKTKEKEKEAKSKGDKEDRRRSMIAPLTDNKIETKLPAAVSGIDAVLLLDIDNETSFKRMAGRRVDTITGDNYHLELNAPPVNNPGTYDRLFVSESEGNSDTQLQYQIAAFEEQEELLKDWFSRFNNLHNIDAAKDLDMAFADVNAYTAELIKRKEKEKEERDKELERQAEQKKADEEAPDAKQTNTESADNKKRDDDKKSKDGKPASGKGRAPSAGAKSGSRGGSAPNDKGRISSASKDKDKEGKRVQTPGTSGPEPLAILENIPDPILPVISRPTTAEGKKMPSKEFAEVLADQWSTLESTYTDALKFAFRSLRREREAMIRHFYKCKVDFKAFLERPDRKQSLVQLFQTEYNQIEDDLRSDLDAKAEIHQRAEDLREKLWDISDTRKDEAEAERLMIIEDKWVEDHFAIMTNIYITIIQAEVDRFCGTRQLVLDYYRDSTAMTLSESTKAPIKIPMLSLSSQPPIDIGSALISTSSDNLQKSHKREATSASAAGGVSTGAGGKGGKNLSVAAAPPNSSTSKKLAPSTASKAVDAKHVDKDHAPGDADVGLFSDIQNAIEMAMTALSHHDDSAKEESNKKIDKKKPAAADSPDQKVEPEPELSSDIQKIFDIEDAIFHKKMDRIKQHASDHLKELRNKGIEVYSLLDEWIGMRFQAEMDAIKEMLVVIKDAIESESRLPNELVLEGEKFKVDYNVMTYEPEPEPRPESPVEKPLPDQFTVLQLLNLCLQFYELGPGGFVSCKEFVDGIQRLAMISVGMDILPEYYLSADMAQLQQVAVLLDPYQTGYVNWRKFLICNARILPIPAVYQLIYLRTTYRLCSSFADGKVSKDDFMKTPLWFEDESDDPLAADDGTTAKFNRPSKLKHALFCELRL
ncbi:uncharacterized protein BJ171DRAFT_427982 [Polychytrium aggregatum]|uniref:uncharacterized protein n=1 Tax=Polychytrium aggregatum TaxID=110093 RepID=UPI0022FE664E|nr:uncharacterized protein BJ171DRAFT_427982 [Polychytrium aggregatum]KAI9197523.1 hypothetical protein BJ171DRAFT_427982 [Polychytrium aggregatum]